MAITIILLIIIAGGVIGAASIIAPKLPLLATLDVDSLPMEKEARKKREILLQRIETEGRRSSEAWRRRLVPLKRWWGKVQLAFRIYVGKVERLWRHEQLSHLASPASSACSPEAAALAVREAEGLLDEGRLDQAEELFIAAIKLDKRFLPAYRGLGDTYTAKGELAEARETYQFLARRAPGDDAVMVKLAEIAEIEGDFEAAIRYLQQAVVLNDSLSPRFYRLAELLVKIKQPLVAKEAILSAVELEPKNPKYLDLLVEIAILCDDAELAERGYQELRLVNPDNNKLESFRKRIREM